MALEFAYPWLVISAAALALGAGAIAAWKRRAAPVLFSLAAAALLLSAAGPRLGSSSPQVLHVVVLDVSDSMTPRLPAVRGPLQDDFATRQWPQGHSWRLMQLSDALRADGSPVGGPTLFERLADTGSIEGFNGELVLVTDGRGELAGLARAHPAARVVLLPAVSPENGDVAISGLRGPSTAALGAGATLYAELFSDRDGKARWRLVNGARTIAEGEISLTANAPKLVPINVLADQPGVMRFALSVEAGADRDPRNDRAEFPLTVGGARVVEYVRPRNVPEASDALLAVLRADPRNVVHVRHDLPRTLAELEGVGLVVLNDQPLRESGLAAAQLAHIADWVKSGGSLLMAGAGGAFAPGGYRGTALEEVMPVKFRPDDEPPRHNLLLLDTSSSMAELSAGGVQKLSLLRDAARAVVAALDPADRLAITGFHARLDGDPVFSPVSNGAAHEAAITRLAARGRTLIRQSLAAAIEAMAPLADPKVEQRILLVTDGEEGEASDQAQWAELAARLSALNFRLHVVLTQREQPRWLSELLAASNAPVTANTVGERGFDALLEAIEAAMATQSAALVLRKDVAAPGLVAQPPAIVRTSARKGESIGLLLQSSAPGVYPLLATRELVGRTGVICTETAGNAQTVALWQDPRWQALVGDMLRVLLENAGRPNLSLLPLGDGSAELTWVGAGATPPGDLRIAGQPDARRTSTGRWLIEALPNVESLEVSDGDRILQRIALPRLPSRELARTGNDPAFFSQAEAAGIRVLSSLDAWQPRRFGESAQDRVALEWLPAALAALLMLAGFARRRRRA